MTTTQPTSKLTPDDFLAVSSPRLTKAAFRAARRYAGVPETMSDTDAIAGNFLSPAIIELFMQIFSVVIQDCLSNQSSSMLRRVRGYTQETNEYKKLGDTIRLQWITDRWINHLGLPRDRGDVKLIVNAITQEAAAAKDEEITAIQTEVLWLTV